jgi:hypothetical protein
MCCLGLLSASRGPSTARAVAFTGSERGRKRRHASVGMTNLGERRKMRIVRTALSLRAESVGRLFANGSGRDKENCLRVEILHGRPEGTPLHKQETTETKLAAVGFFVGADGVAVVAF